MPLRLPRSRTATPSGTRSSSTCMRETVGSEIDDVARRCGADDARARLEAEERRRGVGADNADDDFERAGARGAADEGGSESGVWEDMIGLPEVSPEQFDPGSFAGTQEVSGEPKEASGSAHLANELTARRLRAVSHAPRVRPGEADDAAGRGPQWTEQLAPLQSMTHSLLKQTGVRVRPVAGHICTSSRTSRSTSSWMTLPSSGARIRRRAGRRRARRRLGAPPEPAPPPPAPSSSSRSQSRMQAGASAAHATKTTTLRIQAAGCCIDAAPLNANREEEEGLGDMSGDLCKMRPILASGYTGFGPSYSTITGLVKANG